MVLSEAQLDEFEREGWLLARQIIPVEYIHALQDEIDEAIDVQANKLLTEGKITELHADKGFLHRTEAIWGQCSEIWNPVYSGNHAVRA